MSDSLDWYGDQLRRARERRRRRAMRASALAVGIPVLVMAGLFLGTSSPDRERAAVPQPTPTWTPPPAGTWTPAVGRPDKGIDVSISRAPISREVAEAFAVLRRPQAETDRRLAEPLLRWLGPPVDGVQVDAVRMLDDRHALVPVQTFGPRPGAGLCVVERAGSGCNSIDAAGRDGVGTTSAGKRGTRFTRAVPDGVARVRFTPRSGDPVETDVRENFYVLQIPVDTAPGRVKPPAGWNGPTTADGTIEGPPMPVDGKLEWFDADGSIILQRP